MKLSNKQPQVGDRRIVTRFLWFPKWINNVGYWWETRSWIEYYSEVTMLRTGPIDPVVAKSYRWVPARWVEQREYVCEDIGCDGSCKDPDCNGYD